MMTKLLLLACLASVAFPACGSTSIRMTDASGGMDDATITARVKTMLLNDQQVGATKIDVSTTNGIVTVSGSVKTAAEAARAVDLARQVTGVREVKSTLQVNPMPPS
jgi:hyperosmotically inducible periplasmic protein